MCLCIVVLSYIQLSLSTLVFNVTTLTLPFYSITSKHEPLWVPGSWRFHKLHFSICEVYGTSMTLVPRVTWACSYSGNIFQVNMYWTRPKTFWFSNQRWSFELRQNLQHNSNILGIFVFFVYWQINLLEQCIYLITLVICQVVWAMDLDLSSAWTMVFALKCFLRTRVFLWFKIDLTCYAIV